MIPGSEHGVTGVERSPARRANVARRFPGLELVTTGLLFSGLASISATAQPFSSIGGGLLPLIHSSVAWADYDQDGKLDCLIAGSTYSLPGSASFTGLYRNSGNGAFALAAAGLPAVGFGSADWGDYDNDGDVDLLLCGYGGGTGRITTVFRNDGGGGFTDIVAGFIPVGQGAADWGDFDNDGRLDVALCGVPPQGGSVTRIYRNLGGDVFTDIQAGLPGPVNFNGSVAWGDYDNDSDLDLLVLGGQFTRVYRNDNGQFVDANAGLPGAAFGAASWGDYDNDGDLDLALTGIGTNGVYLSRIYANDGGGTFADIHAGLPGAVDSHVAWGDFDNDGRRDLILTGTTNGLHSAAITRIYRNLGNGSFTDVNAGLAGVFAGESAGGDFDGDGDLDLLVSGWLVNTFDGDTRVYRNITVNANPLPAAPTNLVATVAEDETVSLTWSASTEGGLANPGLTYNLRVGTTPAGIDVVAPEADPVTGRRALAAPGRVTANHWVLRRLPRRTYYWSVQAVDAASAGSPFAAERSFVVTSARPGISQISDQATFPDTPVTIPFFVTDDSTPPGGLQLFGGSTNELLVPAANLVFTGSGTNRALTLTPAPGRRGSSAITVSVRDTDGRTNATTFVLRVEEFTPMEVSFPDWLQYSSAAWGDYDNDGDLDFVVGGEFGSTPYTLLYQNDGRGRFRDVPSGLAPLSYAEPVWGDYDNDGFLDLFLSGFDNSASVAHVYRNNRTGGFDRTFLLDGALWGGADWGDYDNDGDLDLVYSGSGICRFYRNVGGTNFANVPTALPGLGWSGLAGGDFDNDSDRDLILGGTERETRVFRNVRGAFVQAQTGIPSQTWGGFDWADFDNDGDLDLAVCGAPAASTPARVFQNDAGFFTDIQADLTTTSDGTVAWGDYDNDGDPDLLLTGWDGIPGGFTRIYRNDGGTFLESGAPLPGAYDSTAVWGDFDNDGDLDILLVGTRCAVLRNNSRSANTPPAAPGGLAATLLPDNNVQLLWAASTDSETPSAGLHYNLRVGTSPGGHQIMTPHAEAGTGWRRLPKRGNAGAASEWLLLDVPRGTYHWSVQSIDAGFAGSPFAAEGAFTITNARPTISAIADQTTLPGVPTVPLVFTIGDFETPSDSLNLTVRSSNTNLLRDEGVTLGGAAGNRTVTLAPELHRFGVTIVTLTVTDPQGLSVSESFTLTVPLFSDSGIPLPGVNTLNGAYAAWGDYDNDDDLDLLLGGYTGTAIARLYLNNGAGALTSAGEPFTPVYGDTATGDFDNDGDLDIFAMGLSLIGGGRSATLYRNNGNGAFTGVAGGFAGAFRGMPAWADYDNDGRLDLMLCGSETTGIVLRVYHNNGDTSFTSAAAFPTAQDATVAWGDYDNDGDWDILSAQPGHSRIYRNDGAAGFVDAIAELPGVGGSACAWADFNSDGHLDFALCGASTNDPGQAAITRVFRNQGDGTFVASGDSFIGVSQGALVWGDFDNDGSPDLVVTGMSNGTNVTRLYTNQGGTFGEAPISLPQLGQSILAAADFDKDGDLDVVIGGSSSTGTITRLFRNNLGRPNAAPSPPPGMAASVLPGNDVQLTWDPASDDRTPAAGLRYNFRVGTQAGGVQIVSPHANVTNGFRRVLETVGAGFGTRWRLPDLPRGDYFWSVQAIDAGLAGSAFAAEAAFSITNARPVITALPDVHTAPNTPTPGLAFTIGDFETPAAALVLAGRSSDTNLVPDANIMFAGSGSNWTVTVLPTNSLLGSATITVTVTDASGGQRSDAFVVFVDPFTVLTNDPGFGTRSAAWGDYDNDGDLDLLLAGALGALLPARLVRNDSGNFTEVPAGLDGVPATAGVWGDYDHDGLLDILVAGFGRGAVFRNLGNGAFADIQAGLTNTTGAIASWADYDNDGDPDILVSTYSRAELLRLQLYRNDGGHAFTPIAAGLPPVDGGSAAWGDYDRDGDLDLLLSGRQRKQQPLAGVYRNDGNGVFTDIAANLPAVVGGVAWGDFDNDGDLDILLGGRGEQLVGITNAVLFRNDAGLFNGVGGLPELSQGSAAWGDFDNDGLLDILLTGVSTGSTTPTALLHHNNGDGTFSPAGVQLPGARGALFPWGDFDNDGDLDLVLAGDVTRLVRNNSPHPNAPAAAPQGLSATVSMGGWVNLSWIPAIDLETQTTGLNYNLRVGDVPGGERMMAPAAVAATGLRRLPRPGNAGPDTAWRLRLPPGNYFWSAQAIDTAFAGSQFSVEAGFTVPNTPPIASDQSITLPEDTASAITLQAIDPDLQTLLFSVITPPDHGTLSGIGPNLIYHPGTNYFGPDAFTFVADDGLLVSGIATVTIEVTPVPDVSFARLTILPAAEGEFRFTLQGEPYQVYAIDVSEDLDHWTEWRTLRAEADGSVNFEQPVDGVNHRFYRPRPWP